jgi:MYXO-CTERM domain-containing protein
MSKVSIIRAGLAAAVLAMSPAAFAQENTANTVDAVDPALNTTADPLANDANLITADPLANDPMMAAPATDPLAADPMLNEVDADDDDDDGRFPWGLLGLLGLAGLLGTRRRDDDVRVDRTRDTR